MRRLQQYGSELWCVGYNTLYVYSLDCELLRSVQLQNVSWCTCAVKVDADRILVATLDQHALLVNEQGKYIVY